MKQLYLSVDIVWLKNPVFQACFLSCENPAFPPASLLPSHTTTHSQPSCTPNVRGFPTPASSLQYQVSCNLTQSWPCLSGESTIPHRVRAQAPKTAPASGANARAGAHLCFSLPGCKSEVPTLPPQARFARTAHRTQGNTSSTTSWKDVIKDPGGRWRDASGEAWKGGPSTGASIPWRWDASPSHVDAFAHVGALWTQIFGILWASSNRHDQSLSPFPSPLSLGE